MNFSIDTINNKNNKKNGFTLVEVIVSLLLIGMFLGVFGPAISNIFKQSLNVSDNDESFNIAYNLASSAANNPQNVVPTDVTENSFDISSGSFDLTLDDGSGSKTEYTPDIKLFVYTSKYTSGRFGSSKELSFNDYSVR